MGAPPAGFVRVEPGAFYMGSPWGEPGRPTDAVLEGGLPDYEAPHHVTLTRPFLLSTTPTTQARWRALMNNNPSRFPHAGDTAPVEAVTWYDALAFANQRSLQEGIPEYYDLRGTTGTPGVEGYAAAEVLIPDPDGPGYRLPSEAEWEYACRAGTTTATWRGDLVLLGHYHAPVLADIAWYGGNSEARYEGAWGCASWRGRQNSAMIACGPQPVGALAPNPWGLYDMLGNVWEWVQDAWAPYAGDAIDPVVGGTRGGTRVVRGGAWLNIARHLRAGCRCGYPADFRSSVVGFRLARWAP